MQRHPIVFHAATDDDVQRVAVHAPLILEVFEQHERLVVFAFADDHHHFPPGHLQRIG